MIDLRKEFLFHEETECDESTKLISMVIVDIEFFERHVFKAHCEGFVPLILKVEDDFEMYNLKHVEKFRLSMSEIVVHVANM